MSEKILTAIIAILFLGVLGLTVALGISAASFWVGALAFIGVILSLTNFSMFSTEENVDSRFYILHGLSLAALAGAAWLADFSPLWMIIVLFTFATLPAIFAAEYAFKSGRAAGVLMVVLNLVSIPGVIVLLGIIRQATGAPLATQDWSWSLAVGGIAVLIVGLLGASMFETGQYFLCLPLGLAGLIAGTWLAGPQAGWWWLLPWGTAALAIGIGGGVLPRWHTKTGIIGIIVGILVGLVGVGLPLMNTGILPNPFLPGASPPAVSRATAQSTLSEIDILSTQLAEAEATATQGFLDEQRALTQTQQALALAAQSTPTPLPTSTATIAPTETAASVIPIAAAESESGPGPGFFPAIGTFLWAAIKSVWGILYLLLLLGLAQIWIKQWGWFLCLVLLLLAVGFFGGRDAAALAVMADLVSSGPANWWLQTLRLSYNLSGTIGWGILGFSVLVTILVAPAIKISLQYSQKVLQAQQMQLERGTTAAQQFLSGSEPGCRESLATSLFSLASFSLPISLWVALHRLGSGTGRPFPFLFIPDLTVPHWKPVWHYSYFVLGGIFLLTYLLYLKLLSKSQPNNPFARLGMWGAIPASILMTLLAPGGLALYTAWQLLLMSLLLPVFSLSPQPAPEPLREAPKDSFQQYLEDLRGLQEAEEPREEEPPPQQRPPEPPPTGPFRTLPESHPPDTPEEEPPKQKPLQTRRYAEDADLAALESPLVGGYLQTRDRLCVMTLDRRLFWLVNGSQQAARELPLGRPMALHPAEGNKLLAVGQAGEVIPIVLAEPFQFDPALSLGSRVRASAVNPYGSLLAYVPQEQPTAVHGFFLAGQRDQRFMDLGDEIISCLAFSGNARYLAAGTESGNIMVVDIATRQLTQTFPDPYYGPVLSLQGLEDEKWAAAYGDGWLTTWNLQKTQQGPVELSHPASSLVVDQHQGRILAGDQGGFLWGYPLDLSTQDIGRRVQDLAVSHIFVAPDGSIITVGGARILRNFSP